LLRRVVWYKFTDVSHILAASNIRAIIALMTEAASTRRNNSEDSHIQSEYGFGSLKQRD
jgi:hypothetical protein